MTLQGRIDSIEIQRHYLAWSVIPTAGFPLGFLIRATLDAASYSRIGLAVYCSACLMAAVLYACLVMVLRDRAAVTVRKLQELADAEREGGRP